MGDTITVDALAYAALLVKAGETDPLAWPEKLRDGAALLERIRGIEADCAARHGKWDWELLDEATQDAYDDACALLDQILRPPDWREHCASIGEVAAALGVDEP